MRRTPAASGRHEGQPRADKKPIIFNGRRVTGNGRGLLQSLPPKTRQTPALCRGPGVVQPVSGSVTTRPSRIPKVVGKNERGAPTHSARLSPWPAGRSPGEGWSHLSDLNRRPTLYESVALPLS